MDSRELDHDPSRPLGPGYTARMFFYFPIHATVIPRLYRCTCAINISILTSYACENPSLTRNSTEKSWGADYAHERPGL